MDNSHYLVPIPYGKPSGIWGPNPKLSHDSRYCVQENLHSGDSLDKENRRKPSWKHNCTRYLTQWRYLGQGIPRKPVQHQRRLERLYIIIAHNALFVDESSAGTETFQSSDLRSIVHALIFQIPTDEKDCCLEVTGSLDFRKGFVLDLLFHENLHNLAGYHHNLY